MGRGDGGAENTGVSFNGLLGLEEGNRATLRKLGPWYTGPDAASKRLEFAVAANARINWTNAMTLGSVAVLVGTELVGAGGAAGWAIGGLFQLGDLMTHILEAVFVLSALSALYAFLKPRSLTSRLRSLGSARLSQRSPRAPLARPPSRKVRSSA